MSVSADPVKWEADSLGNFAAFSIDTAVYDKTTVFKTAYWYTDRCYLFLSIPDGVTGTIRVEIRPKKETTGDELITLCREFCNSLIDQQVRQSVIAETGAVRDSLIKKAFFEGKSTSDIAGSDKYIPPSGESYEKDILKIGRSTGT